MTPAMSTSSEPTRARRTFARRILVGAAIAGVAAVATIGVAAGDAEAARRTKSDVIAAEADNALQALNRWNRSQNPVDYIQFAQNRDRAAASTEIDVELAPGSLQDAWSSVSITKQEALLSAVSQLGVPYRSLASEPGVAFDCSGLTIWAFGEAGVEIPRVSRDQIRASDEVAHDDAEAGDLVYYPGHVSIYLGADVMVHAPNTGSHVEIAHLPSKSLQFGDTAPAETGAGAPSSLMDRAVAITE